MEKSDRFLCNVMPFLGYRLPKISSTYNYVVRANILSEWRTALRRSSQLRRSDPLLLSGI